MTETATLGVIGQQAVTEAMSDVGQDGVQIVSFRLANEEYGIDIMRVQEIILPGQLTEIPQVPECISGLINLRGSIIPVLDLRRRFGLEVGKQTEESRIVVTEVGTRTVGLVVDAVNEVLRIHAGQIEPPPTSTGSVGQGYVRGLVKLEGKLLIMLEVDELMSVVEQT